jgi:hypothetical protein
MKRLILPALVLATTCVAAAQEPSVDGKWKVNSNIAGNVSELNCTFTQKESALTGTCESEQGPLAITGKIEGKTVTWQFEVKWEGDLLTLVYSGTLEPASKDSAPKIVGTVDVQPVGATGDFTADASK